MSVDCAQKKLWLAEAELALHKLLTGAREQTITFGSGKSVTYTAANINQLRDYIARLKDEVDECEGRGRARRSMIRFVF